MAAACPTCGATTTPELRFCLSCGTALAERCPSCSAPRVPGASFCGQCGTRLSTEAPAAEPANATHVGPATTLERRLVSVLFADLVGFTARSESLDPEHVREFLTRYFEAAEQVIRRYGGTVEKFIGDAVMAVWGTPTSHEDDAERAVRAALDLVDAVQALGGLGPDPVELRAAVTSGEAAVAVGASGQGMVAGDLVNASSRLQGTADPGTVLVDETTQRAASRAIAFEAAGEQSLRGKVLPVPAWRALRVVAERGGVGRSESLEPPFVGRDEELRLLKEQLHATGREGKAHLVTLLGTAGMGKSRLLWELQKYMDGVTEPIYWHQGRSPAYGEGIAYWALGEMVRVRVGVAESDDDSTARARLHESVAEWIPHEGERQWVEPRLAALLGVADAPPGEREELFAAWRLFFERIAERGTTVLAFEDLHWADQGLLDFIESMLEWSRGKPILVIGLARPELMERRPSWGMSGRAAVTLHLDAVDPDGMASLLRGVVPGLPEGAIAQIAERSEGVPLFAVETVRMLLDDGRLVREGDRYRLTDPDAPFRVPASLQALIAARLDALEAEDRSLVQDAAILGRTFNVGALAAVSLQDRPVIEARLAGLSRKDLLVLDTDPRSPEHGQWGFVHGLFREIAYGTLSKRDRRARHLSAARHFETLDDEDLAGVLASHYLAAYRAAPEGPEGEAVAAQARIALRAAAERALSLHANTAAVDFFEQALTVTPDPAERAAILLRMAEPAEAAVGIEASMRYVREAVDWYESQGDAGSADAAIARLARAMIQMSWIEQAEALLGPAVARIDDANATVVAPQLLNEVARAILFKGTDPSAALQPIERGLAIAERLRAEHALAELFITKSWAVTTVGRPREAQVLGVGGLEIAQRIGNVRSEFRARMNLSNAYIADDPRRAIEVAAAGIELAQRVGHGEWAASLAANVAAGAIPAGEWDRILGYAEELQVDHLSVFSRHSVVAPAAAVRAFRGIESHESAESELARSIRTSSSAQDRGTAYAAQAMAAFGRGDLTGMTELARRSIAETPEGVEALVAMVLAAHAAIERRDIEGLRESIDVIEALGSSTGEWLVTKLAQIRGALAWLEGLTVEGERAHRGAIEVWRRLDLPLEILLTEMNMLVLGGRQLADRDAIYAEAREIGERLGARSLLDRLEAAYRAIEPPQAGSAAGEGGASVAVAQTRP